KAGSFSSHFAKTSKVLKRIFHQNNCSMRFIYAILFATATAIL
ncbi:hypothetical protein L917_06929, partial [Phytophthora nicotianae]